VDNIGWIMLSISPIINEIFEETINLAVEEKANITESSFVSFMTDYLPPEVLDQINADLELSLSDIWKDRFEIIEHVIGNEEISYDDGCCELCERYVSRTRHHLIPRELHKRLLARDSSLTKEILSKTISICRMCHRTIHRFFTNDELAATYNTLDKLLSHEKLLRYAKWAAAQPAGSNMRVR
jgi:hypothetical protein